MPQHNPLFAPSRTPADCNCASDPEHCTAAEHIAETDVVVELDDLEDLDAEEDAEAIAAHTTFTWTVEFKVSGTWVADGFNLTDDRAMTMLRNALGWARDDELGARVLAAPPAEAT
jgi:hypothetical protein